MAHDFFSCDGRPLAFDVTALVNATREAASGGDQKASHQSQVVRSAFMLCHLIPTANKALAAYQRSSACSS